MLPKYILQYNKAKQEFCLTLRFNECNSMCIMCYNGYSINTFYHGWELPCPCLPDLLVNQ